jgi:hypothetical protein
MVVLLSALEPVAALPAEAGISAEAPTPTAASKTLRREHFCSTISIGIGFTPGFSSRRVMTHDRSTVFLNPSVVMTILSHRERWLSTDGQQRQFRAAATFGLAPSIPSRASSNPIVFCYLSIRWQRGTSCANQLIRLQKNVMTFRLFPGKETDGDKGCTKHQAHQHYSAVCAPVGIVE